MNLNKNFYELLLLKINIKDQASMPSSPHAPSPPVFKFNLRHDINIKK